jgi:type I restriction enzyme S subunit
MSKIKLTEACNIVTGKLDANAAETGGKYPYFTCAPEPLAINTFAFDDDVILLAGNNASGKFHCQRYKGKFNAYQRTYVITVKQGYDIEYIYYNLKINLQNLKKKAQGSQTKFLTMQILDGFQIEDISIHEQKKATEILAYIDEKIENNNKINTELELMAKTIYDYWFLQFEFPNDDGKPYKSSGGKMIWNEELKREIPRGWKIANLNDIASITMGTSPKGNSINTDGNGIAFYQGKAGIFGSLGRIA